MNTVELVKSICKERKIPISKLERDLGYANGYIGQLRKGTFPSNRLAEIAQYLSIPTSYLMNGGNEDEKEQPADSGELSEAKKAMYDFVDSLSDDQVRRLLQIAHAAFEK